MSISPSSKKSIPIAVRNANPFLSIQNELDKAISGFHQWFENYNFLKDDFENLSLLPAMDVVDDKNEFKIAVEMPGMSEEDIKVSINNGILTIKGEKSTSSQDKDKNYLMREIKYGVCERNITLPDGVNTDQAKASFKKGMLWVKIPKKPELAKGSREIKVEKA